MDATAFPPLTYGQVKANKDAIEVFQGPAPNGFARTQAAEAFLKASNPDADLDRMTPVAIQDAALDLYTATFYRPESVAPVPQNP